MAEERGTKCDWSEICVGTGRSLICLQVNDTGHGLVGLLTGGESAHVGGVVLALPRQSISNKDKQSCDLFSIPVPGHLDNVIGQAVATTICKAFGETVSLSTGIHLEHASETEIIQLKKNAEKAARRYIAEAEKF